MSKSSTQSTQPDHEQAIQNLHIWIKNNTVQSYDITKRGAACERGFIPRRTVERYLQDNNFVKTKLLLKALFPHILPVGAAEVAETCPRVFCILILLGKAKYIGTFTANRNWLSDRRLPFDVKSKPTTFPESTSTPDFYEKFCEAQWLLYSPLLESSNGVQLDDESILPFRSLEITGGGGSATVFKATIHEEHDRLPKHPSDTHLYAIKTFSRSRAEQNFQREVQAFKRITDAGRRNTPGMIEFYGSFRYQNTFNIVLEYADGGTLESYFHQIPRPQTGHDIVDFWDNLFRTLDALFRIHENPLDPNENTTGLVLQGWHQDLKPANILVVTGGSDVSPYKYLFKIADLNLSHFKTIMEGQDEALDQDAHGTEIYGAPECYSVAGTTKNRNNAVRRNVDIWSIGAIYSEAAVWVVKGADGVVEYRDKRQAQTDGFQQRYRPGPIFHNGEECLSSVHEQHEELRPEFHLHDYVTGPVIDRMIGDNMLVKERLRDDAFKLIAKYETIITAARKALSRGTITTIPPAVHVARPGPHYPDVYNNGAIFQTTLVKSPKSTLITPIGMYQEPEPLEGLGELNEAQALTGAHTSMPLQGQKDFDQDDAAEHEPNEVPTTPVTSHQAQREPTPFCSVAQAYEWYKKMKYHGNKNAKLPFHDQLIWELKGRDHVFMVDDSESMKHCWDEVVHLIRILAYITKRMDPDRLELYFLSSNTAYKFRSSADLANTVHHQPAVKHTNLDHLLAADLREYGEAIDRSRRSSGLFGKKPALHKRSIYILTDGVLKQGTDRQGYEAIKAMTEKLAELKYDRDQIGIQLIRFRNDQVGIDRLDVLDNLSKHLGLARDIVDTQPANGNVWKMLLGAINELFDDDDPRPMSPLSPSSNATGKASRC